MTWPISESIANGKGCAIKGMESKMRMPPAKFAAMVAGEVSGTYISSTLCLMTSPKSMYVLVAATTYTKPEMLCAISRSRLAAAGSASSPN